MYMGTPNTHIIISTLVGIWICTQEIKSEVPPERTGGPEFGRGLHRLG